MAMGGTPDERKQTYRRYADIASVYTEWCFTTDERYAALMAERLEDLIRSLPDDERVVIHDVWLKEIEKK